MEEYERWEWLHKAAAVPQGPAGQAGPHQSAGGRALTWPLLISFFV